MIDRVSYFCSTIGRKQLMAIAGLALCGFVLSHALGNMLIFKGPEAYNRYSHALISNPLIYAAEAGLAAFFIGHIIFGAIVTFINWRGRPTGYAKIASGEKRTSWTTRTMAIQGIVLLVFLVLHLEIFKFGTYYEATYGNEVMRDLFKLVYEVFQSTGYMLWYIAALLILCFHLSHGLYSALQTLGLNHPKYTPKVKGFSILYGIFISFAFISQPLYMHFIYKG